MTLNRKALLFPIPCCADNYAAPAQNKNMNLFLPQPEIQAIPGPECQFSGSKN